MKPYSSKNVVVRKTNRSQYKPYFKKQKAVDGYLLTKFNKQQTTSVFTGYNRFVLSNFNSLNTAQKLNQKNSRNVKRFYKFITGSSLNKVS